MTASLTILSFYSFLPYKVIANFAASYALIILPLLHNCSMFTFLSPPGIVTGSFTSDPDFNSKSIICFGVISGKYDFIKPATPAATGLAILVPSYGSYPLPKVVELMYTPGAKISTPFP